MRYNLVVVKFRWSRKLTTVSYVSLGCPKALVDSEHIVTALADEDFSVVGEEESAGVVVVNTCGFINQAKEESYAAIEAAIDNDQEVVVTGCLGTEKENLRERFPSLRFVSGPGQTTEVVNAVKHLSQKGGVPVRKDRPYGAESGNRVLLTPDHYAYLKIAEGCNHQCTFCVIPRMRGPLESRGTRDILAEAEALVKNGVKELMLIAQDLSAYGLDNHYGANSKEQSGLREDIFYLCNELSSMLPWIRLHYVYPYPHVDKLVSLMADSKILPYLDMPLQHASSRILKAMKRPASREKTLNRIHRWRELLPDLSIRSNFIVGFPGETDEDLNSLLEFLDEAKLDRVGCFTYSEVSGAKANDYPGKIPERDKLDRQDLVYEHQASISQERLQRHLGKTLSVIIDGDIEGETVGRTVYDAPEIDGLVYVESAQNLNAGDLVSVKIDECGDHDLYGEYVGHKVGIR